MKLHHWVIIGATGVAMAGDKLGMFGAAIGFTIILAGLIVGFIMSHIL